MARKAAEKPRKGSRNVKQAQPASNADDGGAIEQRTQRDRKKVDSDDDDAEAPIAEGGADSEDADSDVLDDDDFGGNNAPGESDAEESDDEGDEEEDGDEEGSKKDEDDDEKEARRAQAFQRKLNKAAELELQDDMKRDQRAAMDSEEDEEESDDETRDLKRPLSVPKMRQRIAYVLQVLADFKGRAKGYSRSEYMDVLLSDLRNVYDYSEWLIERFARMFPPAELIQFLDANDTPRPETLRANTLKVKRRDLAQALIKRGINVDPLEKWSKEGLVVYESSVALGGTPEYLAGHYMLQAAASLLPVLSLNPLEGEKVLDVAAAPGGKTTHLCQLMKNNGIVVANDISKERLRALTANVHRLGCSNVIVVNYNGRELPRVCRNMDRVLLDAPCTGSGIISKDPKVKMTKSLDDLRNCTKVQKELLLAAIDCCNSSSKDNLIVYSTCSVLYEENEDVVQYALNRRHVRLVDTGLPFGRPGFVNIGKFRFQPEMALCKRFYPHIHNLDGFFVAKLQKYDEGPKQGKWRIPRLPRKKHSKDKPGPLNGKAAKPVETRPPPPPRRLTREERAAEQAAREAQEAEKEKERRKQLHQAIVRRKRRRAGGDKPIKKRQRPNDAAAGGPADAGPSTKQVGFDTDIVGFKQTLEAHDHDRPGGLRPRKSRRERLRRR